MLADSMKKGDQCFFILSCDVPDTGIVQQIQTHVQGSAKLDSVADNRTRVRPSADPASSACGGETPALDHEPAAHAQSPPKASTPTKV